MPVIEVKHPLVKHKVGLLREHDLSTKAFRELTSELARLLAYEATADFPLRPATIQGWRGRFLSSRSPGARSRWCRSCAPGWACSTACST